MLRLPFGARGLLAAAALAGAVVYWRASSARRSREALGAIDEAIAEGRAAADRIGTAPAPSQEPFHER